MKIPSEAFNRRMGNYRHDLRRIGMQSPWKEEFRLHHEEHERLKALRLARDTVLASANLADRRELANARVAEKEASVKELHARLVRAREAACSACDQPGTTPARYHAHEYFSERVRFLEDARSLYENAISDNRRARECLVLTESDAALAEHDRECDRLQKESTKVGSKLARARGKLSALNELIKTKDSDAKRERELGRQNDCVIC